MKKIFMQKIFVVLKLGAYYFEISSFSSPGCFISFILHLMQLVCGMAQFYFIGALLEFLEGRGLKFSKIEGRRFVSRVRFYWLTTIENT